MCRRRLSPRLEAMNTDYSFSILIRQRQQDFAAEAAADRLARLATAGRTSWWHRLGRSLQLRPAHGLTAHRVAH
jgi:hypothetical protein